MGKAIATMADTSVKTVTSGSSIKRLKKSLVESLNKSIGRKLSNASKHEQIVDSIDTSITLPLVGSALGIWQAEQVSRYYNRYTLAQYADIKGRIDVSLMQRAIALGLAEVDTIHSQYAQQDEASIQVLLTDVSVEDVHPPKAFSASFERALELMENDIAKPLSASGLDNEGRQPSLYQHWLIKVADDHYLWYQRYHHICVDQTSMAAIGSRIAEIYTALIKDVRIPPSPFKGYVTAVGQYQAMVVSQSWQKSRLFWSHYLHQLERGSSLSLPSFSSAQSASFKSNVVKPESIHMPLPLKQKIQLETCVVEFLNDLAVAYQLPLEFLVSSLLFNYFAKLDPRYSDSHQAKNKAVLEFGYVGGNKHDELTAEPKLSVFPMQLLIDDNDTLLSSAQNLANEWERLKPHQHYDGAQLTADFANNQENRPVWASIKVNLSESSVDLAGAKGQNVFLTTGPVDDIEFWVTFNSQGVDIEMVANPQRYCLQALILHGHRIHFLFAQMLSQVEKLVKDYRLLSIQEITDLNEFSQDSQLSDLQMLDGQLLARQLPQVNGINAYIFDKQLNLAPIGVAGDLYLAGQSIDDLSANESTTDSKCLVENPFDKGTLMYATDVNGFWDFNGDLRVINAHT